MIFIGRRCSARPGRPGYYLPPHLWSFYTFIKILTLLPNEKVARGVVVEIKYIWWNLCYFCITGITFHLFRLFCDVLRPTELYFLQNSTSIKFLGFSNFRKVDKLAAFIERPKVKRFQI